MNALIVDDERNSRELLTVLLQKYCPIVKEILTANSVDSALQKINTINIDILFLDIEMPQLNGFALLDALKDTKILTCMVTGYEKYAIKAIEYGVNGYLLKPVDIEDLKSTVNKVSSRLEINKTCEKKTILVTNGSEYFNIDESTIINIAASGNYVSIHLKDGKRILPRLTLSQIEKILCPTIFQRTHRSHIVNVDYISSINEGRTGSALLKNGQEIPVANRRIKDFMLKFKKK